MGNLTSSPFSRLHPAPDPDSSQDSLLIMPPPSNPPQKAIFSYLSPSPAYQQTKLYEILPCALLCYPKDHPATNITFESRVVDIQDIRGREKEFSLDCHGFCFLRHETRVSDLKDEGEVKEKYIPEIEDLLRRELGLGSEGRVFVFGWKVRSSASSNLGTEEGGSGSSIALPTRNPHVDQSPEGAVQRVRYHLPDEAEELLKERVRILNVWRPLQKVTAWPLALCDARTVAAQDLVPKQRVGKHFTGESYLGRFSEKHAWCYLGNMERDEVVIMKIFDSRKGEGRGGGKEGVDCALHSSFELQGENWRGERESIEVRVIVIGDGVENVEEKNVEEG